jgi:spore coat polysaccharide biosynthesis protein SpsF
VQIFTFRVLEEMEKLAKEQKYREHVSLYILKHPTKYKMHNVAAPIELTYPDWHLELDEYKDYELIRLIYENLYFKNPQFTTSEIIALLKEHPEWLEINKDVHRVWEESRKD